MTLLPQILPWIVVGLVAVVWGVLRHQQQRLLHQRALQRSEQRHRERVAALEQGIEPPAEDEPDWIEDPAERRATFERRVLFVGVALVCGGLGAGLGLLLVPRTPETLGMREMASYGLAPIGLGLGMLLYLFLVRRLLS